MNDAPTRKESVAKGFERFTGYNLRGLTSFIVSYVNGEEALRDLRLPPELVEILRAVLSPLGWTIEDDKAPYTPKTCYRQYTGIKQNQGELERVLLHMPAWFLMEVDNYSADLALLPHCFRDKKINSLFICCSESLGGELPDTFQNIMPFWESMYNIKGTFIPWSGFQNLEQKSLDEQTLWLQTVLRLNTIPPTAPDTPLLASSRKLTGPEQGEFKKALLDAYPKSHDLEQFVVLTLDKPWEASSEEDYPYVVFQLIRSAVAEGWINDLILKAQEDKPQNLLLRDFVGQVLRMQ
jgi:hypothetical protein